MEFYQDHESATTPKVSFTADTQGFSRSHSKRKPLTPLDRNKGVGAGKKTPKSPMQAFRNSLIEGTSSASKGFLSLTNEKENSSNTPGSAQSFRRTLRGGGESSSSSTKANPSRRSKLFAGQRLSTTALGPPKRVEPKTPNSLLRSEMGDDDDDEEEESFLVSPPPGALWNVLGESKGLVIVSPQAAMEIQQQQQKHANTLFESPPLKPRALVANASSKKKIQEKKQGQWFSLDTKVSSTPQPMDSKTPRMDLSTMFSDQKKKPSVLITSTSKNKKKTEKKSKLTQLDVALNRLEKDKDAESSNDKENMPSKNDSVVVSTVTTPMIERGNSFAMDFTSLFSDSKPKPPPAPQHLAKRMQEREKQRPPLQTTTNTLPSRSKTSKREVEKPKILAAVEQQMTMSEPVTEENGLMDFSAMFSKAKEASPPPMNLTKRMQHREKSRPPLQTQTNAVMVSKKAEVAPPKDTVPAKVEIVEPVSEENGLMDFSAMFSMAKVASPPPMNLTKRMEKKEKKLPPLQTKSTIESNKRSAKQQKGKKSVVKQAKQTLMEPSPMVKKTSKNVVMATPSTRITPSRKFTPMSSRKYTPMSSRKYTPKARAVKSVNDEATNEWAEKQSETFVNWLNYTFNPSEDEETEAGESLGGLRMLIIHRHLAQARMRASGVFFDDRMQKVKNKIRSEIAKGRLSIRSDRDIYYDLSLRKEVKTLLQSYTTPWLRLGLEVMFGECIMVENVNKESTKQLSHYGRMRNALGNFIVNRLLSDPAVLHKYTKGKCKIPSGRFEKQFRAEIRSLVLYRIMVLIFFLDQAKMSNVLDKVPRLFAKGAAVKSSRELLLTFCRKCLSSEGDFIKHLSRMGLTVSYKQDPVDELDFNITNLATDLRDGSRLTRLTEIITEMPTKSLMSKLRLPPISRLQKLHNLNLALCSLDDRGILLPEDVHAHHIVDGHRGMVLKLMWSIIAHSCMEKLLEGDLVEAEICNVIRSNQARRKVMGLIATDTDPNLDESLSRNAAPEEILKSLLFRWCQAVCSSYGLKLKDFTSSFANGKALCYLLHYYHPSVLRMNEILPTLSDQQEGISEEQAIENERKNSTLASKRASQLGGIPQMIPSCDSKNPPNERSMLLCLTYLCSRLMESSKEILATILIQQAYRKYQGKVLLEKKKAAAKFIFEFWSKHKDNYYAFQKRSYARAVATVESFVIAHKDALKRMKLLRLEKERQMAAVLKIQRMYRGSLGRKEFNILWEERQWRIDAALCIQSTWRGFVCRQEYLDVLDSVVLIQCLARGNAVRNDMRRKRGAALLIQRSWWECVDRWERTWASTLIQSIWRGYTARMDFETQKNDQFRVFNRAATTIQSTWRGFSAQVQFQITLMDIISIQSLVRQKLAIRNCNARLRSVAILQRGIRCWLAQRRLEDLSRERKQMNESALIIQSQWRSHVARSILNSCLEAVTRIQAEVRAHIVRKEYLLSRESTIVIQKCWRGSLSRANIAKQHLAATLLQSCWRGFYAKTNYELDLLEIIFVQSAVRRYLAKMEVARRRKLVELNNEHLALLNEKASIIQKHWRGFAACIKYRLTVGDVITVQSVARRRLARRYLAWQHQSAIVLQSVARKRLAMKKCAALKARDVQAESSIRIQSLWRGNKARQIAAQHAAARKIQKTWRCFATHIDYLVQVISVLTIQASVRRFLAQESFKRRSFAVIQLQAFFRGSIVRKQIRRAKQQAKINAAIVIQKHTRGFITRIEMDIEHFAATEIQRMWRGYDQYSEYIFAVFSAIKIQSCIRGYLQRVSYHHIKETKAASVIQVAFRSYIARFRARMIDRAAICLQAAFRAHIVRRGRTKKAAVIARKVLRANMRAAESPNQRLSSRTSNALKTLQTSTRLSEIMDAVKTLEVATRLSKHSCKEFTDINAAKILLDLIRACNRSLPHVELVHWILLTLENIGQHSSFLPSISDCKSAEVFLDKVQMFRDKDGIFCLSVSLLRRIIVADQTVLEFCGAHEHLKRLKGIHRLSTRRSGVTSLKSKPKKKRSLQKYERREVFERPEALKALGELIEYIEMPIPSTARSVSQKRFVF